MAKEIIPFLMFPGGAEAAMNFYRSLFPNARIESLVRAGRGRQREAGDASVVGTAV
jgi:predicted 3-demethylubiquinone-9 3-methyltransferase (glyoxalase superfamily)